MPNLTTHCRDAFGAAEAFRQSMPLPSGQHKLREAREEISLIRETVHRIGDSLCNPRDYRPGQGLGKCVTDDRALFLKRISLILADLISRKILPGIEALAGDGVPPAVAAHESREARKRAEHMLARCEALHARLKAGIAPEYGELKRGESEIFDLLDGLEDMADWGLRVLDVRGAG